MIDSKPKIRLFEYEDIAQIIRLENASNNQPLTKNKLFEYIGNETKHSYITKNGSIITGYVMYEIIAENRIEITNLVVDQVCRRRKIGTTLINYVHEQFTTTKNGHFIATLKESDLVSQLFFKKCGYFCKSVLHKYYTVNNEDAYLMKRPF